MKNADTLAGHNRATLFGFEGAEKRGEQVCEGAWIGARASAGPREAQRPARDEGKASERPDLFAA